MDIKHFFLGSKKRALISILLSTLLVAGAAFGIARIISNILSFGPIQHVVQSIELTTVENLPPSLKTGEEGRAEFEIRNLGSDVTGVALKARVKAGTVNLASASAAVLKFEDPDTGTKQTVTLAPVGGNLEGTLKSAWSIPRSYSKNAKLWLTLTRDAPQASYSIEVWVEVEDSTTPPPSTTRSFTLNASTSGFVGVTGTNADGSSIAGVTNPVLKVNANETVRITVVRVDSVHNVAVYTVACPDGFCSTGLLGRSADVTGASTQATLTVTAPASGTLYYHCDYHAGMMRGTIQILP